MKIGSLMAIVVALWCVQARNPATRSGTCCSAGWWSQHWHVGRSRSGSQTESQASRYSRLARISRFERLEPRDLRARLLELLRVDLAHAVHRGRGGARRAAVLDVLHDRLDVREAEAEVLELLDPADADERLRTVEPVAPLRASGRLQQVELLVEVDGAHRLAGLAREVADLHERVESRSASTRGSSRGSAAPFTW